MIDKAKRELQLQKENSDREMREAISKNTLSQQQIQQMQTTYN